MKIKPIKKHAKTFKIFAYSWIVLVVLNTSVIFTNSIENEDFFELYSNILWFILLFMFAAMTFAAFWLVRALNNANALTKGNNIASPTWTVLMWFIPIVNLIEPFRQLIDIWKVTATKNDPGEKYIRVGQGLFITMFASQFVLPFLLAPFMSLESMTYVMTISVILSLLYISCLVVATKVVDLISEAQESKNK